MKLTKTLNPKSLPRTTKYVQKKGKNYAEKCPKLFESQIKNVLRDIKIAKISYEEGYSKLLNMLA